MFLQLCTWLISSTVVKRASTEMMIILTDRSCEYHYVIMNVWVKPHPIHLRMNILLQKLKSQELEHKMTRHCVHPIN